MARVLMIEPDPVLARSYQEVLKYAGHQVTWRQNAQEAIDSADGRYPDIVLLELQLSGHNGAEFLYEFRSYLEWCDVPVVVVSMVPPSHPGLSAVLEKYLGVVKYCYKPQLRLSELVSAVNQYVSPQIA